jgi:hypothetical protein
MGKPPRSPGVPISHCIHQSNIVAYQNPMQQSPHRGPSHTRPIRTAWLPLMERNKQVAQTSVAEVCAIAVPLHVLALGWSLFWALAGFHRPASTTSGQVLPPNGILGLGDQGIIGVVVTNPKPQVSVGAFDCKSAIAHRHAGRPDFLTEGYHVGHAVLTGVPAVAVVWASMRCQQARDSMYSRITSATRQTFAASQISSGFALRPR